MSDFLQYIDSFSTINKDALEALSACFKPAQLKKNDFFARQGEYSQKIGFLQHGVVRAFFVNKEAKEYNKQFFVGPSIIGAYSSLLTKRANVIAQQAMTDCEILVADFSEIEKLYDSFHDIERLGRKIAEFYFLEKEQKEIEMALLDADKRYLIMREKFPTIELIVPQYHVASYLGISATQLSRIRRKFKES